MRKRLTKLAPKVRNLLVSNSQGVCKLEHRDRELTDCERIILDFWNRNHAAGLPCYYASCQLCRIPNIRHFSSYQPSTPDTLPDNPNSTAAEAKG